MVNALTAEDYLGIGPTGGSGGSGLPSGSVTMFAGTTAPNGFLFCDGSEISRSSFSTLFTAVGTTYGIGNGSSTFNLPDMRGRSPLGEGTGGGLTARALGDELGEEDHQLTEAELASHNHTFVDLRTTSGGGSGGDQRVTGSQTNFNVDSTGGDAAHNTMHPSLVFNFIIKT